VRRRRGGIGGPAYADQVCAVGDEPEGLVAQQGVQLIRVGSISEPVEVSPGLGVMIGPAALPRVVDRPERYLDRDREKNAPVGTSALACRRASKEQGGESRLKKADKEASWQQPTRSNDPL
jgi:hypothetical protein